MTFRLDTTGVVQLSHLPAPFDPTPLGKGMCYAATWNTLTPFAQGYVEALFSSLRPEFYRIKPGVKPYGGKRLKIAFRAFDPGGGALREVTGYVHVSASKVATAQRLYRADELELPAFSDLAPETLARMIADCEARQVFVSRGLSSADLASEGAAYWRERQDGLLPSDAPLTVHLGDDGKVRFAEAVA